MRDRLRLVAWGVLAGLWLSGCALGPKQDLVVIIGKQREIRTEALGDRYKAELRLEEARKKRKEQTRARRAEQHWIPPSVLYGNASKWLGFARGALRTDTFGTRVSEYRSEYSHLMGRAADLYEARGDDERADEIRAEARASLMSFDKERRAKEASYRKAAEERVRRMRASQNTGEALCEEAWRRSYGSTRPWQTLSDFRSSVRNGRYLTRNCL